MLFVVDDLHYGYTDVTLLDKVSLTFEEGDRIGLIGANGVGKTTFLRLVTGELTPDGGQVIVKKGLRVGFLHQKDGLEGKGTVWQEMQAAFADLYGIESQMRAIEAEMAHLAETDVQYRVLAAEHTRLENIFLSRDGYHIDVRIKTVLGGMGFGDRYDMMVANMSGGEKTRLALAKLLLSDLDLLLLDEPTNHLDMATLQWLEEYLATYKGGLLIVSHDRYFMDKTVNKIWDMEGLDIREWKGNYTKARALKAEWVAATEKLYARQQAQVAAMLDYAQRNIVRASTSKSAKSRLHRIEGMDLVEKPLAPPRAPRFVFGLTNPSNRDVLQVRGLCLAVADKTLVPSLSFALNKGERMAIIGPNGVGKSTLMKTLLGLCNTTTDHYNIVPDPRPSACVGGARPLRPLNGCVRYGQNVNISYYDQENINLDDNADVLDELWFRFPQYTQTYVRSVLANMLFGEEDMHKKVHALSGGEKAKLGFALIMCENSNLLLLDEPTNHLDLAAREGLESALARYEGTVLFVSHDRYFTNAVATHILELTPRGGTVYEGNYDAYLAAKQRMAAPADSPADAPVAPPKPTGGTYRTKEEKRQDAQRRDAIRRIEREIAEVEAQMAHLNDLLCSGTGDYRDIAQWDEQLRQLTAREEELFAALAQLDQ